MSTARRLVAVCLQRVCSVGRVEGDPEGQTDEEAQGQQEQVRMQAEETHQIMGKWRNFAAAKIRTTGSPRQQHPNQIVVTGAEQDIATLLLTVMEDQDGVVANQWP
ncbi:hypothetical protein GUITHDRAFT_109696 [Guillardia theta CCMP2712]|uniref:Uncharacterized protein n=1 Tax=Guillardia theta (strain CCMP2712) TaxID=905079 RepID=L1J7D1_GUITC|nr:hypothetical protein GUITHDRAFT_109696 [Guillardia theta CCMP2712]EKX44237.1 hypothetical protein GUITHDRAFT_109696 [Guillardia theta CCMP2712]|mmetsp:Transcript_32638/g.103342  ORF Transcript_32638/g.103342 Transcript_32638/m.103342 type:complete len:106 (-) Transcript_32638:474-791(-)|eukprot:XP_005831217.1 hypothetical protein GUITHDRAFT_109696 [Guillardia theta CCMP2712]